ncbi:MAG: sugar ABC transporter permease, partial [Verrucomicrobia bacterium]|nr:sugar ABC transporter permease [Verrucomicrobiota bacterium]
YLSLFIKKRIGIGPAKEIFGGVANYIRAVQDTDFLNGLNNMFLFGIVQIPAMLGLAILLALLLDQTRNIFTRVCRTVYFMPYGIPTAIGALIWGYMYAPNLSPFNQILRSLHQSTIDFLSPGLVLFSIGNIVTWTWTGYNMITLFAALQNIPKDLYEAARVDGATEWNVVRHIKIPLVIPTLRLLFIFSVIGTSQLFTEALVLRPLGYVADNITPNLYLYLTAARDANYSYAGALAILLAVLIFIISGVFLRRVGSR